MSYNHIKKDPMLNVLNSTLVTLPAPQNISYLWNFGSLLGVCLITQIISGLLLASTYTPSMAESFTSVSLMVEANNKGWMLRSLHANGASLFFFFLYAHTGRGIFYGSYLYTHTWNSGVTMFLLVMASAFLGYVLPNTQMSFWGASVITNLFSEFPYLGPTLVQFIWGGPSVNSPTIIRFFTFHFLLPFLVVVVMMIHITLLHMTGSSNPLGLKSNFNKMKFQSFFTNKDLTGVLLVMTLFLFLAFYYPVVLGDDENFNPANPSVTPHHIQPEWYFLFAYAILRSIPNKLGGVIALILSVTILYSLPYINKTKKKGASFYPLYKMLFWFFVTTVFLLTWIGARPVEDPYILTGQILTFFYFLFYLFLPLFNYSWDLLIKT